jgi:lipoate-protein ligase A
MAVDETLLESAVERGVCTVRVYRWSEATVSLGYFQPAVRRLTGGGAIAHHHEITYSVCLPASHAIAADPTALYGRVHAAIIALLNTHRIVARLRGAAVPERDHQFLCFGRGDRHDVLVETHKVVGSAQRRRRGAVLQHGSLLFRQSEFAPEFAGLCELTGWSPPTAEFDRELGARIASAVAADCSPGTLSEPETQLARRLEIEKYSRLTWNRPQHEPTR